MRSEAALSRLESASASPGARFQWHRKRGGYEIVKAFDAMDILSHSARTRAYAEAKTHIAETLAARKLQPEWYDPAAEHPALFQEAVKLDGSDESLVQFANEWGLPEDLPYEILRGDRRELLTFTRAELRRRREPGFPLNRMSWQSSLEFLGRAVRAWEVLNTASQIREFFECTEHEGWVYLDRDLWENRKSSSGIQQLLKGNDFERLDKDVAKLDELWP